MFHVKHRSCGGARPSAKWSAASAAGVTPAMRAPGRASPAGRDKRSTISFERPGTAHNRSPSGSRSADRGRAQRTRALALDIRRVDRIVDRLLASPRHRSGRGELRFDAFAPKPFASSGMRLHPRRRARRPRPSRRASLRVQPAVRSARRTDRAWTGSAIRRRAPSAQPRRGIVGAQRQAIFGARGHHPIGLADALQRQVVDHHADIARAAVEADRRQVERLRGGVEAGRQALRRRLLIAGRAVDLPGEEQARRRRDAPASRSSRRGSTYSYSTA